MDWNALIPAAVGFAGVLVGLAATTRAERRRKTLLAARRAALGLVRWERAARYIARAPDRLRDKSERYDIYLAMELHTLASELDNDWWDKHGVELGDVADDDQWERISHAGEVTAMLLTRIRAVGDAGAVGLRKSAKAESLRRRASALRSAPAAGTDQQQTSAAAAVPTVFSQPEAVDDDSTFEAEIAQADRWLLEFKDDMAAFDAEFKADLAEIDVHLDHRLALVRGLADAIVAAADEVTAARLDCAELARRHRGLLGDRHLRRRRR